MFVTNYNDNKTNIFDKTDINKTQINTTIYDYYNKKEYTANCKLWKQDKGIMILICKLNQKLYYYSQNIILKECTVDYHQYEVHIFSNEYIEAQQVDYDIPILYSDNQVININNESNTYTLNFNIKTYNNELLILNGSSYSNQLILDKCKNIDNVLNCEITKEQLESILTINNEQFTIYAINDNYGLIELKLVQPITISYDNVIKEDIYISITEIIRNNENNPLVFNTSFISKQEFHSGFFDFCYDNNCFFKKIKSNNLYLFCYFPNGFNTHYYELYNELVLKYIHYKYNFIILPFSFSDITISITSNVLSNIFFAFPHELDFKSQNSMTMRFIGNNIQGSIYLSIVYKTNDNNNIIAPNLNCNNFLQDMKICNITISHFSLQNYKEVDNCFVAHGYYNLYYEYLVPTIKVTLPPKIITITISYSANSKTKIICKNGIFYLISNFFDDANIFDDSTIEEKTGFKTIMITDSYYNQRSFGISCRLWKLKNNNIYLICKADEDFYSKFDTSFKANFNEATFNYKDYRVIVLSNDSYSFVVSNSYCPFLYADDLSINLRDQDISYELKFRIESYNNESLLFSTEDMYYIGLENCTREKRNLICKIDKEKILEQYNIQVFKLYYINELTGFQEFDLIPELKITSSLNRKETIYVQITSLLSTTYDLNNSGAYSTNVTQISNVFTGYFLINEKKQIFCFLKKAGNDPLYLLCKWQNLGSFTLGQITNLIILDNINIRYNFRIVPGSNTDTFTIGGLGSLPLYIYPQVIDFYFNDSISVYIRMENPEYITSISLDYNYLSCENSNSTSLLSYKKCIINKSFFKEGLNQYYNLFHNNYYTNRAGFYELTPIFVITPKNNEIILRIKKENNMNTIQVGNNGVLCFVTSYYDNKNIFSGDIETVTEFKSQVVDENNNEYDVNCRLWNPQVDKIRIICRLNQNLKYEIQNIMLKDYSFEFNGYIIYIYSDIYIEANQLNYDFSFLYSTPQYIEIDSSTETFNLTFKMESYNKNDELLYLCGTQNNYLILDNCVANDKNLNCNISREKIDEILTNVYSNFSVGIMNDNFGTYKLNHIFNITIYRYYSSKINIYVSYENSFREILESGVPFGFNTNVSDIENLVTDKYDKCYFIKIKGRSLLYACTLDERYSLIIRRTNYNYNLDNIHWKYNFIITPNSKEESFYIESTGSIFKYVYPDTLDFSNKDAFVIRYIITNPALTKNVKLVSGSSNLQCEDLNEMKKCIIPYTHLRRNNTGYFFTHYSNSSNIFTEYYTLLPIYVNLPSVVSFDLIIDNSNNKNILYIGQEPVLYLVTNFDDTSSNIFDDSKFSFNVTFNNNKNDKIIEGNCDLWKTKDSKIRFICKLKDIFENDEQNIYVDENSFTYNNYKIIFYTNTNDLKANQFTSNISFLYSDKREINMETSINSYNLRFEKKIYNKQQLELYNNKGLKKIFWIVLRKKHK